MPLTVRVTGAVKPADSVSVKLNVVLDPRATVAAVGLSLSVKLGGTVTDSMSVIDFVNPPPAALIVITRLPLAALALARNVSTLTPDPVNAAGEKVAVTPLGKPLALNATAELKPFEPLTTTLSIALPPCTSVADDALWPMEKLGGTTTATDIGSVPVSPPPLAVMAIV